MDKVIIPQELIDVLQRFGPLFLKVAPPILGNKESGKNAVEHAWQDHPYNANDKELQSWLNSGGNYGVMCSKGFAEIDLDDGALQVIFEANVKTFTVQTGRTGGIGRHYYILTNATENGALFEGEKNIGNIQIHDKYVVGPNSKHFTGGIYKIINNVEIATVDKRKLEKIFGDRLKWAGEKKKENEREAEYESNNAQFKIPIAKIIPNFTTLDQIGSNEFQGEHPMHGSTTGHNFCVNVEKNVWHCFRCNSGGGPLMWLAVQDKLITCAEAQKGILKGELFAKTVEIAKKLGYDKFEGGEKPTTLNDVDFSLNPEKLGIDVAGGANEQIVYDGIRAYTKELKTVWIVVWHNGKEAGLTIVPPDGEDIEIDGINYKIRSRPVLAVPGLWTPRSAASWVKNPKKIPDKRQVYENIKNLYEACVDTSHLLEYSEGANIYAACDIIATYFYEAFSFFPYDAAIGNIGGGKTAHLITCGLQSYHASQVYTSPTAAIIFRVVDSCKPTLLYDNAENIYDKARMTEESAKTVEIFDAGFKKGAKVPRCEGDERSIREYGAYCPKRITSVMGYAPSLLSRAIPTRMIKTDNPKFDGMFGRLDYFPLNNKQVLAAKVQKNRDDMYILRMILWREVEQIADNIQSKDYGLGQRFWDLWLPIFTVAKIFCTEQEVKLMLDYTHHLCKEMAQEYLPEVSQAMIETLSDMCPKEDWYKLQDITAGFRVRINWETCTPRKATGILNYLGFTSRDRKKHDGYTYIFVSHVLLNRYKNMLAIESEKAKVTNGCSSNYTHKNNLEELPSASKS